MRIAVRHSTLMASGKATSDLKLAIDRKEITFVVLFDVSTAFDTVNKNLLLTTLNLSNIVDKWFKS